MSQNMAVWRKFEDRTEVTDTPRLERIGTGGMNTLTLAVTIDTSHLALPETNWVLSQAKQVERRFMNYIEGKDSATTGEPRERAHRDLLDDSHGPEMHVDVYECSDEKTEKIQTAIDTLEEKFVESVREAGY